MDAGSQRPRGVHVRMRHASSCYYQGCSRPAESKEHLPPKAFFPKNQRKELLTVPSCHEHNQRKSSDDVYVLAHICMNAAPSHGSREVFLERVAPQLEYNGEALRKAIAADAVPRGDGAVIYRVDIDRCDRFFTALSCGIVFRSCVSRLPDEYEIRHVYHDFIDRAELPEEAALRQAISELYSGEPMKVMDFGAVPTLNGTVYSVKIFGMPRFASSITLVHEFYRSFHVTSMLTRSMSPLE